VSAVDRAPGWVILRNASNVNLEAVTPGVDVLSEDPTLTAALLTMGLVDTRDLPLLAAYWLGAGHEGPSLVEMAVLTRNDVREISDTWPMVLAEVCPNFDSALARRRAAQYLADEHLQGRLDLRRLLRILWPAPDGESSDATLDGIVYQLDELADGIAVRPSSEATSRLRLWPGAPTRAELEQELAQGLSLLAAGDFRGAGEALGISGPT